MDVFICCKHVKTLVITLDKLEFCERKMQPDSLKSASKNLEFAQMQDVGKILQRSLWLICKQEIFPATQQLG